MLAPARPPVAGHRPRALRSSEALQKAIVNALRETGRADLQSVHVQVANEQVRLTGLVQSYYAKQTAQVVAMSVADRGHLENDLNVTHTAHT
jgi:osmotically-inducible protein OsmY